MDYYKLLQLSKEPFSNSPDPDYFFKSQQHLACLQKLELALRLKRGLNVVIGDVGTGKTTLCRELIRRLNQDCDLFETHLILDPAFPCAREFINSIGHMVTGENMQSYASEIEVKEKIKQTLFQKGVEQNRTLVLIIDEGQKISSDCVEILRELLNYETNSFKLLQIIIFAQKEFGSILEKHDNLTDRINMLHHLQPMNFRDTRLMIQHRLKLAGAAPRSTRLFTRPAMWAIYRATGGYPRKIINLCHQSLLAMIIQNHSHAGWRLIRSCTRRMVSRSRSGWPLSIAAGTAIFFAAIALIVLMPAYFRQKPADSDIRIFKVPQTTPGNSHGLETAIPGKSWNPHAPDAILAPLPVETKPGPAALQGHADRAISILPQPAAPASGPAEAVAISFSRPQADTNIAEKITSTQAGVSPPRMLGQLTVEPGDTIAAMARKIYGSKYNRHLWTVIEANPRIKNADTIEIGETVNFPVIEFHIKDANPHFSWIIVKQCRSLPDARTALEEFGSRTGLPTRLIATWSPATGLRFELAINGYFVSEQAARNYMQTRMQAQTTAQARIIHAWPEEFKIYTDPYTGGVQY
jgi:general secretion pathway protein A